MFSGRWIFIAMAALSGILFILELHLYSFIFIAFAVMRLILEKHRKLLGFFLAVLCFFMFISFKSEKVRISMYEAGTATFQVTFTDFPEIDGDRLSSTVITSDSEKLFLNYQIKTEREQK